MKQLLPLVLALLLCVKAKADSPAPRAPQSGLNVVFIGDSNTEIGYVTGGIARYFDAKYGFSGSGFRSLVAESGNGLPGVYQPYLTVENQGAWKKLFIVPQEDRDAALAPNGVALQSDDASARATVKFYGQTIDVFYAARPDGGSFAASLDGGAAPIQSTLAAPDAAPIVKSLRLSAAKLGEHTLQLHPQEGAVTLLGVSSLVDPSAQKVALVHKWGRGYAQSRHFVQIAPSVHESALKLLQPDVVAIMLGTNDHNLDNVFPSAFVSNIGQIVARVKTATPHARIVLLSTIPTGVWPSDNLRESYRAQLPLLAKAVGADYFDLAAWAGGTSAEVVARGLAPQEEPIHFNAQGGEKVGAAIADAIEKIVASPRPQADEKLTLPPATTTLPQLTAAIPAPVLAQIPLWLCADGAVEVDARNRVARWNNSAPGNFLDDVSAAQPIAAQRPLWVKDAVNGLPALDFDGAQTHLTFDRALPTTAITVVCHARKTGGALFGEGRTYYQNFGPGPDNSRRLFNDEAAVKINKAGATIYLNGRAIAPDKIEYPLDGFAILTLGGGNVRTLGLNLHHNLYVPAEEQKETLSVWDGQIAEVVVYANVFDDARRGAVESYLGRKYGIAVEP